MSKSKKQTNNIIPLLLGLILGLALGVIARIIIPTNLESFEIPAKVIVNNEITVSDSFNINEIKNGSFSVHFLELGNKYTGDSSLIDCGETEVLIDAGSKTTSIDAIYNYTQNFIDKALDYIIITHAHEDHYAGFSTVNYEDSLFAKYNVNENTTIIYFSQITTSKANNKMYKNFMNNLTMAQTNGAHVVTCRQLLEENHQVINLGSYTTMEILDQKYYYEASNTENNHSVCILITNNGNNYLFTGDLEKEGELSLIEKNTLPNCYLYKAGHHGSKTSSCEELMEVVQPKNVCVCCCCGSSEYTTVDINQFPTQQFINNVKPYTENIYVTTLCVDYKTNEFTSMNGNIVFVTQNISSTPTLYCSNNTTVLKDTDWYKEHRI